MPMNISSRRATSAAGNEPAHPAYPPMSTRLSGTARWRWKSERATIVPKEWPTTCGRSRPSVAMKAADASANCAARQLSSMSDDRPNPGASQATTVWSRGEVGSIHCQVRLSAGAPCSRTSGGPVPARS